MQVSFKEIIKNNYQTVILMLFNNYIVDADSLHHKDIYLIFLLNAELLNHRWKGDLWEHLNNQQKPLKINWPMTNRDFSPADDQIWFLLTVGT